MSSALRLMLLIFFINEQLGGNVSNANFSEIVLSTKEKLGHLGVAYIVSILQDCLRPNDNRFTIGLLPFIATLDPCILLPPGLSNACDGLLFNAVSTFMGPIFLKAITVKPIESNVCSFLKMCVDKPKESDNGGQIAPGECRPYRNDSLIAHQPSRIFFEPKCSRTKVNHMVLITGYGTDPETGDEFCVVRNSWSTSWGESGYVRMARNKNNHCGIASYAQWAQI